MSRLDALPQNIEYFDWLAELIRDHSLLRDADQLRSFVDFINGETILEKAQMTALYNEWADDYDGYIISA